MPEFEDKAENICSYCVLLSLTSNGPRAVQFRCKTQTPLLTSGAFERRRGNPSRMLAAGNAAKRQAVLCPRQPRLGLLDCGACCGDPSKVVLWRENWKARLPP